MPLRTRNWLAGLALAALVLPGQGAWAKQTAADPVDISSLSGAFLAARVAEVDNDLPDAIDFYKRALSFDPDNQQLQQSLMLGLISQGRFQEALPYAEKLKSVPRSSASRASRWRSTPSTSGTTRPPRTGSSWRWNPTSTG